MSQGFGFGGSSVFGVAVSPAPVHAASSAASAFGSGFSAQKPERAPSPVLGSSFTSASVSTSSSVFSAVSSSAHKPETVTVPQFSLGKIHNNPNNLTNTLKCLMMCIFIIECSLEFIYNVRKT